MPAERVGQAEAALGGFHPPMRDLLVPILLYKSHFLGDWFLAIARAEQDESLRSALLKLSADCLRESLGLLAAASEWDAMRPDPARLEGLARTLHTRAIEEMVLMKELTAESVLLAAMQAPTPALREKLRALADLDREHADVLRALVGADTVAQAESRRAPEGPLGAHAGRLPGRTLGSSLAAAIARVAQQGVAVRRVVVSPTALRHLRDEGEVAPDGTIQGFPAEVDFAWGDECFALMTTERVSLASILTRGDDPRSA